MKLYDNGKSELSDDEQICRRDFLGSVRVSIIYESKWFFSAKAYKTLTVAQICKHIHAVC